MTSSAARPAVLTETLVVGGGFFGAWLALELARRGRSVVLLERENELLRRASFHNQARVHNGYHYPRSILTGLRSRVNSARFLVEFDDCIERRFTMYYAIARTSSNVTAAQFKTFCARIQAPLRSPPRAIRDLFDAHTVEDVFAADEWAFDAERLAARITTLLAAAGVKVFTGHDARTFEPSTSSGARVVTRVRDLASDADTSFGSEHVFNCTYAGINDLMRRSGVEQIALRQEFTELALVRVPDELRGVGVTVMCGPFFSFMPFPARGLHTLSHVRYTPHASWLDREETAENAAMFSRLPRRSKATFMQKDAARYMPIVSRFEVVDSLWELKTVLPQSEADDSRPILFKRDAGIAGLHCVLGGKIDNVYDMGRELEPLLSLERVNS